MFIDASALVAITLKEPEGAALAAELDAATDPITTPLAIYEAVLAVARKRQGGPQAARADIQFLLTEARIRCVPIVPEDGDGALEAFGRYGKGQGHPAQLNMGDCFAYTVARRYRVPLLFTGDDFSRTDVNAGSA